MSHEFLCKTNKYVVRLDLILYIKNPRTNVQGFQMIYQILFTPI
jgi:hypothetical protein